jgi:hypothetical protein
MQSTQAQPVMSALRTATKVWLAALCFGVPRVGAQTPSSPPTPMQVVRREIVAGTLRGASHGDVARYRPALLRIYADSTSRALWLSGATLTRQAERMLTEIGEAENRGLRRNTPVFVGELRYVVFHPYWDVPASIARNEEIPRIRRDPAYAEREGLEIVRGGDVGATVYPVTRANLGEVAAGPLRLRQRPGPGNALGPVKFVFPNRYNVYLHGTPTQSRRCRCRPMRRGPILRAQGATGRRMLATPRRAASVERSGRTCSTPFPFLETPRSLAIRRTGEAAGTATSRTGRGRACGSRRSFHNLGTPSRAATRRARSEWRSRTPSCR